MRLISRNAIQSHTSTITLLVSFYITYFKYFCFTSYSTGPAPEGVTNKIFELTKSISEYKICPDISVDLGIVGCQSWDIEGHKFTVTIKDSVQDYVDLMKEIFDFPLLKTFLDGSGEQAGMKLLVDSMNGGKYSGKVCPGFL